jgi:hypothetical protein
MVVSSIASIAAFATIVALSLLAIAIGTILALVEISPCLGRWAELLHVSMTRVFVGRKA